MIASALISMSAACLLWAEPPAKPAKPDTTLDGRWVVTLAEQNGERRPREFGAIYEFAGGKLTVIRGDGRGKAVVTLDHGRDPKGIRWDALGEEDPHALTELHGVVELSGDTLRICLGTPTHPAARFDSTGHEMHWLVRLKRVKP